MKVILCGYHWAGCKALSILIKQGHEVFVYTHESPYYVPSMIDLCEELKIPYSIENISNVDLPFKPDIISSIYYRYIIKEHIIDACNGRIFNLHPSLLPKYRGCSSLTWAIINGEREAGFTYHYIDKGTDTGNVILQEPVKIEEWDSQMTLYNRVIFESMNCFSKAFDLVAAGYEGAPQVGESSYYKRGCPFNGEINSSWDIDFVKRFIRAMHNPPLAPAMFNGKEIHTIDEYLGELSKETT